MRWQVVLPRNNDNGGIFSKPEVGGRLRIILGYAKF